MISSVLAIGLLLLLVVIAISARRRNRSSPGEVASGLRKQALHLSPKGIGLSPQRDEAWGVVMDTAYPDAAASLISLADGSASIYFSTGGGVIGGQAHESVANAARAFVQAANRDLKKLQAPPNESLPKSGYTRFFVLTGEGKRFAEAEEQILGEGQHELSPLFYAGQEVITQLRLISQDSQAG